MNEIIEQYKSIPYFNNKHAGLRGASRAEVGKGSPQEIFDEVEQRLLKEKIKRENLTPEALKKFLVDEDIGIDCSGFVYHVLGLKNHLAFPFAQGTFGKIKCKLRPAENADVKTYAHDANSTTVELRDVKVGDIITMTNSEERDHVVLIYKIESNTLYYVHAVAWPTDGEYGHGIHEGTIEITDTTKKITDQVWTELGKRGQENYTHARALKSQTELRRFRFLC